MIHCSIKRKPRQYSLRVKLICLTLLACIPPSLTILAIVYNHYQTETKLQLRSATSIATTVGADLSNYLNDVWATQEAVAHIIGSQLMTDHNIGNLLRSLSGTPAGLMGLSWLTPDGLVKFTTLTSLAAQTASAPDGAISPAGAISFADLDFVQKVIAGADRSVSHVQIGPISNRPGFSVAYGIHKAGSLQGILIATIDISHLGTIMPKARAEFRLGLIDDKGNLVYDTTMPEMDMPARKQMIFPAGLALQGQAMIRFQTAPHAPAQMGAAISVPEIGWTAYAVAPESTVLGDIQRGIWQSLCAIIAALGVSLVGCWYVGTSITSRIMTLHNAAEAIAGGDLNHRLTLNGTDELTATAAAFNDMAQQLQIAQAELRAREERLRITLDAGQMVIWEYDPVTERIKWSASGSFIPGLPQNGEISLATYLRVIHHSDRQSVLRTIAVVLAQGKEFSYEHRLSLPHDQIRWLLVQGRSRSSSDGSTAVLGILMDITGRKQAEDGLRYLSFHDSLTGLRNRSFCEMELQKCDTEHYLPISLIMVDVNGLKLINDGFGHQYGDQLLKRVAHVLRLSTKKDAVVARWGGDEFVILLPKTDERSASDTCEYMLRIAADQPAEPTPISIAIGYACKTQTQQDIHAVLAEAEARMYRRKLLDSRSAHSSIISSLARTLRERNHETEEHARRLQQLSIQIGHNIGLPPSVLDELSLAAALHDIGKVGIDDYILRKPGPLDSAEWEQMRKHVEIGYRIALSSPEIAPIARAILFHHEWWNGSGYPEGLHGKAIPLISRILAIVDAYDVMTHNRPYKPAMSESDAVDELQRCAGTQFDPFLVEQFIAMVSEQPAPYTPTFEEVPTA